MSAPGVAPTTIAPGIDHDIAALQRVLDDPKHRTGLDALTEVKPSTPVVWVPRWNERDRVVVEGPVHLGQLITTLEGFDDDCFGGVQLVGSTGPWAQVMAGGHGEFLLELHPHLHLDGGPGGMYFERIVPVGSAAAGRIAWDWVRKGSMPDGYQVEWRVIPDDRDTDVPM